MKQLPDIKALLFRILVIFLLISCEKNNFNTDANATLVFSTDTLSFDTVFTSMASATLEFRVRNPYAQDLEINSIQLSGGASSDFRLNIDGAPEYSVSKKLLRARDSMYIFVDVTIDPKNKNEPFLKEDRIIFNTNGKEQEVLLQAYGQDAHHIRLGKWGSVGVYVSEHGDSVNAVLLESDTVLSADKPYFLHDDFMIGENVELTLAPGVRFFMATHKNIVVQGSVKSIGTVDNPVLFRGHRLDYLFPETPYDKVSGQWGGLFLCCSSYDNVLRHTHIRNGQTGLSVDSLSLNRQPKVKLFNCRIENMSSAALLSIGAEVEAENTLFANCEASLLEADGGAYRFTNCTFANYYSRWGVRQGAAVSLSGEVQNVTFVNCIIDGNMSSELSLPSPDEELMFDYHFQHCLIKTALTKVDTNDVRFNKVIWNKNPLFLEPKEEWDFRLDTLSPAINQGITTHLTGDMNEVQHVGTPDIGAFEYTSSLENE